jgi:hypothetical protein
MPSSSTRHSARTQDRKAAFKARQARIIETQSRHGLTACERLVIAIIGQHENLDTGQCDPGVETIARESGLHERAVYRAIAGAERKGALVITRTGRGGRNGRNSYRLCGGNPDKSSGLNPDKTTLTKRSKNPDKVSPELKELRSEGDAKASPSLGERANLRFLIPQLRGRTPVGRRPKFLKNQRATASPIPASPPEQ